MTTTQADTDPSGTGWMSLGSNLSTSSFLRASLTRSSGFTRSFGVNIDPVRPVS